MSRENERPAEPDVCIPGESGRRLANGNAERPRELSTGAVRVAEVVDQPIDPARVEAAVAGPAAGAVVSFIGRVRDHDDGRAVTGLDYEAHPQASEVLRRLLEAHAAAHPDVIALAAVHRTGHLGIGDVACVIAVSSAHRSPAFTACAALIEAIKQEVPIWKRQQFDGGESQWVGCQ